jgi:hypothetical protein
VLIVQRRQFCRPVGRPEDLDQRLLALRECRLRQILLRDGESSLPTAKHFPLDTSTPSVDSAGVSLFNGGSLSRKVEAVVLIKSRRKCGISSKSSRWKSLDCATSPTNAPRLLDRVGSGQVGLECLATRTRDWFQHLVQWCMHSTS